MRSGVVHLLATSALALVLGQGMSAGGTKPYQVPWPTRGEVLEYRSCGCADSCWVAEVRAQRSGVVKAKLRCDCERLFYARGLGAKEQVLEQACPGPEVDKPKFIATLLQQQLHPK